MGAVPRRRAAALLLAAGLAPRGAAAHVAPTVGDNNRYLKLTPLADRVRLAYTVFYGEVPGAALRAAIDTNRDGTIDPAERQAFADDLAAELSHALDVTIDGTRRAVTWSQVVVGMASANTAAGAFSIDLIAALCFDQLRGRHAVELRDRFALAHPGETEIRFEDSPGVTIDAARVGDDPDPGFDYKILGPAPVLADPGPQGGIALTLTAGPRARPGPDADCARPAPPRELPIGPITGGALLAGLVAGAAIVRARRSRSAAR